MSVGSLRGDRFHPGHHRGQHLLRWPGGEDRLGRRLVMR